MPAMEMTAPPPSEENEVATRESTVAVVSAGNDALEVGHGVDSSSAKRKREEEEEEEKEVEGVEETKVSDAGDGKTRRDLLWKTSLCSFYRRQPGKVGCSHGDACRYAHGEAELRIRPDNTWDPTSERAKKLLRASNNVDDAKAESLEAEDPTVDVTSLDKCLIGLPRKWASDNLKSFLDGQTRNARKACPASVALPEWITKSREIGKVREGRKTSQTSTENAENSVVEVMLIIQVCTVVGIEMNASAVSDAQRNAMINDIKNCRFVCGKVCLLAFNDFGCQAEDVVGALLKEYLDVPKQHGIISDVLSMSHTGNYDVMYDTVNRAIIEFDTRTLLIVLSAEASEEEMLSCPENGPNKNLEPEGVSVENYDGEVKSEASLEGCCSEENLTSDSMAVDGPDKDFNVSLETMGTCSAECSETTEDNQVCKEPTEEKCASKDEDGAGMHQFKNVVAIVDPPRVGLHPVVSNATFFCNQSFKDSSTYKASRVRSSTATHLFF
ncbi:hypothetical protein GW17_00011488, partial [Ensete ventricosum]